MKTSTIAQNQVNPAINEAALNQPEVNGVYVVKSHFGELSVNTENRIFFPNGLIGMKYVQNFVPCEIPMQNMEIFRILQSLDSDTISFLTLPIDPAKNSYYDAKDLEKMAKEYEIEFKDMVILLIASFNKNEKDKVTFNAKAPVLVDTAKKIAFQCILENHKYNLNEKLNSLFS